MANSNVDDNRDHTLIASSEADDDTPINIRAKVSNRALYVHLASADGALTIPISGSVTVTQATGSNLHVVVDSGTLTTVSTVTNVATIGTSITPGTAAGHLGKAEDAPHVSGDTGVFVLAVRSDVPSAKAVDGDYTPILTDGDGYVLTRLGNGTSMTNVFTPSSDGQSLSTGLIVNNQPYIFNGTTEDRARGGAVANVAAATGFADSLLVAQYNATPPTITDTRYNNLQTDINAFLKTSQRDIFTGPTAFTITLASLANSTAGVGRQSTLITGNTARSALIAVKFTVGTTPTINTLIYVYLLRGDGTLADDAAGASDAGITVKNAPLLGTILVTATTSDVAYTGIFDTKFLGSLGTTFGIAVVNSSGVTANSTGGNFTAEYTLIT